MVINWERVLRGSVIGIVLVFFGALFTGCQTLKYDEHGNIIEATTIEADGVIGVIGALGETLGPIALQIAEKEARIAKNEAERDSAIMANIPVWSEMVRSANTARLDQLHKQRLELIEQFRSAGGTDQQLSAVLEAPDVAVLALRE